MYGDEDFSPRPTNWSRWKPWTWFDLRRRFSVRVGYDPGYGDHDLSELRFLELDPGSWWHFSYDIAGLVHGHLGYVPINVYGSDKFPGGDPKFYWRDDPRARFYEGSLFVTWEFRPFGAGDW